MAFIAKVILATDVLFEANPFLRFYFPGVTLDGYRAPDGTAVSYHSDTMFGDSFEQINCWLPISRAKRTNALQCGALEPSIAVLRAFAQSLELDLSQYLDSRNRFFARLCEDAALLASVKAMCQPVDMEYGELLLFDSRVIHGTLDNEENETRVSIDFRLLPLAAYWSQKVDRVAATRGIARRLRGYYWNSQSARQL